MSDGFIVEDLDSVRTLRSVSPNTLSSAKLNGAKLMQLGVLRFAVKYALWAASPTAKVTVKLNGEPGFGMPTGRPKSWQIRQEVAIASGCYGTGCTIELGSDDRTIDLTKNKPWIRPKTVALGYVWSGQPSELPLLREALSAVERERKQDHCRIECWIGGGPEVVPPGSFGEGQREWLHYLPMPDPKIGGRVLIGKKKAALLNAMEGEVAVIAHARIRPRSGFLEALTSRPFEIAAPRVEVEVDGQLHPYLDYVLVENGGLDRIDLGQAILSNKFGTEPLSWLRGRRPYIDGGVTIIDRRVVGGHVFPRDLAWGEAEDVRMSRDLWNKGWLIDYLPEARFMSATSKLDFSGVWSRGLRKIRAFFG